MKQILKLSSCLLLAVLMISGCNSKITDKDLFSYKDSYVGDASAVGNILNRLPVTGYSKDFELQTGNKPYGIILNYDDLKSKAQSDAERKKIIVYTASYLFTLIQNVEWIKYNFAGQEYEISKEKLQRWYDEDFRNFQNEAELNSFIEQHLNDKEKVNQLFI